MPRSAAPIGPVRVLQVEDSAEDAELIAMQLVDAGLEAEFLRVESADELVQAMQAFKPDLVLSDLSMPGFCGHEALRIVRSHSPLLPFVFVSGTMGEETAVQALREGADDYILKDQTARLPTAAARAIRESRHLAEHERVEKELLRSQRLDCLAMLAAGLSHDLRNILQPLLIVPDMLNLHSDDPKVHRLGQVIAECARRGHEMAESMLSFVRGSRAASERISVATLFQAVHMLLQGSLPRGVQLQIDAVAEDLVIDANYTELQQALLNLCLNAIQAMPAGGTLRLSADTVAEGDGNAVRLCVQDTGTGMDEATRAQLFTPFFSTKQDGTGLGLMSCKRIVENYGGRIDVHSEAGAGTTFTLVLPVQVQAAFLESAAEGHGQRLLLVDGDATRLSLIGNALSSQGYDPVMAHDGAIALRALADEIPELLVIDSDTLSLSALNLLLTLREQGFDGPVIVLQATTQPPDLGKLAEGFDLQLLGKPLQMGQVFAAVEQALQKQPA